MGVFEGLREPVCDGDGGGGAAPVPASVVRSPTVRADAIPPAAWPELVGCDPNGGVGALVWRVATDRDTLPAMLDAVADADATASTVRAATNRLRRAASWGVFDAAGLDAAALATAEATVLDLSGLDPAPMNAVVYAVASGLYEARVTESVARLPWLFVDEAHVFFDGVAAPALKKLLTRGRAPGVSLVTATQRPSALPDVAVSQADVRIVHRLTAGPDVRALAAAEPTYLGDDVRPRLPDSPGDALVLDDAAEVARDVTVKRRDTPHDGSSPRASAVSVSVSDEDCVW
jgi:DNA helicase HerA-like ATPase